VCYRVRDTSTVATRILLDTCTGQTDLFFSFFFSNKRLSVSHYDILMANFQNWVSMFLTLVWCQSYFLCWRLFYMYVFSRTMDFPWSLSQFSTILRDIILRPAIFCWTHEMSKKTRLTSSHINACLEKGCTKFVTLALGKPENDQWIYFFFKLTSIPSLFQSDMLLKRPGKTCLIFSMYWRPLHPDQHDSYCVMYN